MGVGSGDYRGCMGMYGVRVDKEMKKTLENQMEPGIM